MDQINYLEIDLLSREGLNNAKHFIQPLSDAVVFNYISFSVDL